MCHITSQPIYIYEGPVYWQHCDEALVYQPCLYIVGSNFHVHVYIILHSYCTSLISLNIISKWSGGYIYVCGWNSNIQNLIYPQFKHVVITCAFILKA